MAAAVTACARIHMYPYISRPDCYYTDTDSVVLGSPLPEGDISSTVLGKFKLEYIVKKGIFLAPKSYSILTQEEKSIIKHKGLAKSLVDEEWFESQYADISRTEQIPMESNFIIDWEKLIITKKEKLVNLGIRIDTKRNPVYDNNNLWVDTQPKEVIDYGGQNQTIEIFKLKYECHILKKSLIEKEQENESKDSEIASMKSKIASMESDIAKQREIERCTD